ncbi:LuxR C-terminal-related transcriptional regulator [Streptomyces sp. NPDC059467]|uniref:helix-turn-helix transcriptional regulator n=1 Tax=Streptomyces sp. NPDC059467 TaxID=3346844 RepID=UPI00368B3FAA
MLRAGLEAARALALTGHDATAARTRAPAALRTARRAGDREATVLALQAVGELGRNSGHHHEAMTAFRELRQLDGVDHVAEEIIELQLLDRYEESEALIADARDEAGATRPSLLSARTWHDFSLGRLDDAGAGARVLSSLSHRLGCHVYELDAAVGHASVAGLRGDREEAKSGITACEGRNTADDAVQQPRPAADARLVRRGRGAPRGRRGHPGTGPVLRPRVHGPLALVAGMDAGPCADRPGRGRRTFRQGGAHPGRGGCRPQSGHCRLRGDRLPDAGPGPAGPHPAGTGRRHPGPQPPTRTPGRRGGRLRKAARGAGQAGRGRRPPRQGLARQDLTLLERAADVLGRSPRPELQAGGAADYGKLLAARGSRAEAVAHLDRAWRIYRGTGARPALRSLQRAARKAGLRRPDWSVAESRPTHGWAALTEAETRIAAHISAGHTNRSAAAALGVSPDTVSTHLRSVFAKLDVHSRVQLVNAHRSRTEEDDAG